MNTPPYEIIDKILIDLSDMDIALKLKRYYVLNKIFFDKEYDEDDPFQTDKMNIFDWASSNGYLDLIKYLYKIGTPICSNSISLAITNNHLDIFKFLHNVGVKFDDIIMCNACGEGNIEKVKFLHEHGLDYTVNALESAAMNRQLDMVDFLLGNGVEYDDEDMLKYLINGY